jgi:hypothetical protein
MAVFGINIVKIDERLRPWVNTYYTVGANISIAQGMATYLAAGEQMIHSTLVSIINKHCWEVGAAANFTNDAVDLPGVMSAGAALPPWFTAEVKLDSANSYPGWKRYRTRVDRGFYDGPDWSATYLTELDEFADYLDEVPAILSTRSGVSFTGASITSSPMPLQLSKAWYNRTPS